MGVKTTFRKHVEWQFTCPECGLGSLSSSSLKEHLATRHFNLAAFRCECSTELFSTESMISHRAACALKLTPVERFMGLNTLKQLEEVIYGTIEKQAARHIAIATNFGHHMNAVFKLARLKGEAAPSEADMKVLMHAPSEDAEALHQAIANMTKTVVTNATLKCCAIQDSTPHTNVVNSATRIPMPPPSLVPIGWITTTPQSRPILEPGEIWQPDEQLTSLSAAKDSLVNINGKPSEKGDSQSKRRDSDRKRSKRDRSPRRRSHRSRSRKRHDRSRSRRHRRDSSPKDKPSAKDEVKTSPPLNKEEQALRKNNTFLARYLMQQKIKIEQDLGIDEEKPKISMLSKEMELAMEHTLNEPQLVIDDDAMDLSDNENKVLPVLAEIPFPRPLMSIDTTLPKTDSVSPVVNVGQEVVDEFETYKNQHIFLQYMQGNVAGCAPPPRRAPLLGDTLTGFAAPAGLPINASDSVGIPSRMCPFHNGQYGHNVFLCGRQIADTNERIEQFRTGGGCKDLRCMKRHMGNCRTMGYCSVCHQPHHPLFCPALPDAIK